MQGGVFGAVITSDALLHALVSPFGRRYGNDRALGRDRERMTRHERTGWTEQVT